MQYVTCETCDQQLPKAAAAIDPRTGKAWHLEHYGAAEDVAAQVATMRLVQHART